MNKKINFDHASIEKKWQSEWRRKRLYSPNLKKDKNPFYNLWMFPYPSAEGLHAGHAFASTGSDAYGRYMRMNGKSVFQPIGYDAFGIHSENYAIKINERPQEVVKRTTKHYEEQMRSLGHGYDWTRTVTTSDPDYYRWTQWLFIKMFEAGLAYKKKATVNFCPSCKTVLADEQVMSPKLAGKEPKNAEGVKVKDTGELKVCERCGTIVEKKDLDQWFFKITKYADRLLAGLDKIDWSERVITAQRNWIGKSHGMTINFKKENGEKLVVFTTRPDTLNAATFIAIADEELYNEESTDKVGEFTGEYAINPLNGDQLPIWKTNYVAPGYGTGNIMGVPTHDERDMEFAKKYHIDIVDKALDDTLWKKIEKNKWGKSHTNYHLRDWLVSRQRYWGAPIPMIDCAKCGWVTVPEKDLPILLPNISDYKPEGHGRGPLANHKEFYEVKCPKCGGKARRETDVMDTFVDSSWYFLRYPSVGDDKKAFGAKVTKKWLPVNLYFGGAEHSVLHLMYSRFVTMVLHDLKLVNFNEPFPRFFAHGLMIKDGAKMSKSRGNVVNPDEYVTKYGADTLRLYLMFMGPMDGNPDFRDTGIEGMRRFTDRVWSLFNDHRDVVLKNQKDSEFLLTKMHQTISKVTNEMEHFRYNTAISSIMEYVNVMKNISGISGAALDFPRGPASRSARKSRSDQNISSFHKISCAEWDEALRTLCQLIAPFAPHMAEEAWMKVLGEKFSVHTSAWPKANAEFLKESEVTVVVQVNGKMRGQLIVDSVKSADKELIKSLAMKDKKITIWIKGKEIKKVIFVPHKLINFVI